MSTTNRPKTILRKLSALSLLLPTAPAIAQSASQPKEPKVEKKDESKEFNAKEFERELLEKGIQIHEGFGDSHAFRRDVDCSHDGNCE